MTGLAVWLDEHEVGWLRPADGERPEATTRLSLAYLERWTAEVLGYALAPTLPLLIPGVGAQGGDAAATVAAGWRQDAGTVIVNSSRAVLYASAGEDFAAAARRVALATREALRPAAGV